MDEPSTDIDHQIRPAAPMSHPATWSTVAVRLLQGVIYHDDNEETWESLLSSVTPLSEYFSKLGLLLVVDEVDAMAYLRQCDEEEWPAGVPTIPRLFRRQPLSYESTLLCVLLRDELRQFEEHDVLNDRCIVSQHELLGLWQAFFPDQSDTVKLHRTLGTALRRLEELKFVKQFEKDPPSWEIRRIVKARLPLRELEALRQSLIEELANRMGRAPSSTESTDSPLVESEPEID